MAVTGNSGTASVFLSRFMGSNAERDWTLAGTIVGDDVLDLPGLDLGPYVAIAANTVPELSSPISFRITDAILPLHYRCMSAVREYMMGLVLPNVSTDPDDHQLVKLPYRPDMELNLADPMKREHCVFYFPRTEAREPVDNEHDKVTLSVQVLLVRKASQKLEGGMMDLLSAREKINQSTSWNPLPDLDEVYAVTIDQGAIFLPEQWKLSYDCSTVVFRCMSEQPIGIF